MQDRFLGVSIRSLSKFKTTMQILALAILILSEGGIDNIAILFFGKLILWLAATLTLYTGYDYLRSGFDHFK